jgi:hypothetical protein
MRALLFDLDNTLLLEDDVTFRAVRTACERAGDQADRERLFAALVRVADDRWRAAPTLAYADRMGIWWGEGLWGEFKGDGDGLRALRDFAPVFRARCGAMRSPSAVSQTPISPRISTRCFATRGAPASSSIQTPAPCSTISRAITGSRW